jgi:SET domain-containing protein
MSARVKNVRHNKPTSNRYVYVAPSRIHAKGLFARQDIVPGTDIVEYDGPRLARAAGEVLARDGNAYVFTIDKRTCIDGSVPWNLARYANHSCDPNCRSVKISGRIWLRTLRPVAKGEEITYDYGYDFANYTENPCTCGSPSCVGYILPARFRDRVRNS